jgi:3-hydroxyacyl-CoA dehydrogenase
MLEENLLGAKVNAGFYRKAEAGIEALDLDTFAYQPVQKVETLESALSERSPARRLRALWDDPGPWGQLGRAHLMAVLAYAAEHAGDIASDIVQIDQAMRWGFNWALGPFELWDLFGVEEVVSSLEANQQRVPDLAVQLLAAGETHFYGEQGAFSPTRLRRESWQQPADDWARLASERAIWSNAGAYLVELDEGMGALVFSGKMNALGPAALEAVHHAVDAAPFTGLVLAGAGRWFSVGADLKHVAKLVNESDWAGLEAFVAAFQEAVQALRYAPFPVVAALRGLVLGGGCEFALGADGRVVAAELGMGLVETKVGLIPGSGGCMEMARRGASDIGSAFETIFAGNFSDNAFQARAWSLLGAEDEIAFAEGQLLERALAKLRSLLAAGYCASAPDGVEVTGDEGLALLHERIDEGRAAGQLSEHDVVVGRGLARVLVGGGGARREVEERHLLNLEREVFLQLCGTERTRQRIAHMLHTGKPLKN